MGRGPEAYLTTEPGRPVRHRRASLIELGLRHRIELPVQLRELAFALSLRL